MPAKKQKKQNTQPQTPFNTPNRDDNDDDEEIPEIEMGEPDFNWGFTHEVEPNYVPRVRASGPRALKGRIGIGGSDQDDGLFALVSSKKSRDIVRRNNFMPGQFDAWNAKKTGGNGKYWGGLQDLDDDGISEFVVKRKDENGPLVAVNGYTTKKSDWIARQQFFNDNPTRAQRKGKTVKSYMRDEVYQPKYDDYMNVRYEGNQTMREFFDKYGSRYNNYKPSKKSPYRAIGEYIVFPAIKAALRRLGQGKELGAKIARQVIVQTLHQPAFEAGILSEVYNAMVKEPVINYLTDSNQLQELSKRWQELRANKYDNDFSDMENVDSEQYKDFEKWLFAKADVKDMVIEFVRQYLQPEKIDELKQGLTTKVIGAVRHKIPNIEGLVRESMRQRVNKDSRTLTDFRNGWE